MLRNLILLSALALTVPTMPQHNETTGSHQARESENHTQQSNPPPATITNNYSTSDDENRRKKDMPWWDKLFAWPEGITAIAIVFTLGAIICQTWETRKAATAAKDAVIEAKKSLDLSSDTAQRQLRAYLCIAYSELRFLDDGTIEPVLHLKNCGVTPAYKVSSWQRGRLREYPLTAPLEPPPDDMLKGVAVVPPNHHHVATCGKHTIPQLMLDSLETKKFAFYVYGEATYIDIFKRKRTLEFRLISGGPAGTRTRFDEKRKMNIGFLAMDAEGNEAD